MATISTSISPIGARQINQNLYVGHNDLVTIQAAVTFAVAQGGIFTVYVPPEYAGTDAITAVTGGSASVHIMDERDGQRQVWLWFNGVYRPEPIFPAGVSTPQMNHYIYVGVQGYWATIQAAINSAVSFATDNIIVITTSYHGTEAIDALTGGESGVFIIDQRDPQMQVYEWDGSNYMPSDFEPMGAIIATSITADEITVGNLEATDAIFDTAIVDGSPVVTFANIGEVGGMDWPPPGIGVSTGTDWGPSLDPASFVNYPPAGVAISTGTAWDTPVPMANFARRDIANNFAGTTVFGAAWTVFNQEVVISGLTTMGSQTGPNATVVQPNGALDSPAITVAGSPVCSAANPGAGIPVSTGTAWGTPIAAADLARLSAANTFTAAQTFAAVNAGPLTARSGLSATGFIPTPSTLSAVYAGLGSDAASPVITWVDAAAPTDAKVWTATVFANSTLNFVCFNDALTANNPWMTVTRAGAVPNRISLNAATNISGGLITGGTAAGATANTMRLATAASGAATLDFLGPNSTTQASFQLRSGTSGAETINGVLLCYNNLFSILVSTTVTGPFYASGTISSGGAKSFRIQHPLDETQDLIHACVEGPECAVFYRGEGVTAGGWAEITLPDYFEALTMPEHRSVLLTALFEEDDEPIGTIAASRVKAGKFRVWSALPAQSFYWEVKAVRADIEPLEIEVERGTQHKGD